MRIANMKPTGPGNALLLIAIAAILPSSALAQKHPDTPVSHGGWRCNSPQITASGDYVYVTWMDERNTADLFDIYFNRSPDGGATWLASDLRLDTGIPTAGTSYDPQIAASGDSVYVTWWDNRNSYPVPLSSDIYFNRSLDGGVTWLNDDLQINSVLTGMTLSTNARIAVSGDAVYVAWLAGRIGDVDIYFDRSLDGGATWLASDLRLNMDPSLVACYDPQIAASGDSVYVTWQDNRNGAYDIYLNRSLDGGASWLASDIRLDTDQPGAADSDQPRIAVSGDSVYVTWRDMRSGPGNICLNRSLDRGASWLADDIRLETNLPGSTGSGIPQIATSGDSVYVTWQQWSSTPMLLSHIYFNRSLDGGVTWLPSSILLDWAPPGPPGSEGSFAPQIAASGDSVYVTWADRRNNGPLPPSGFFDDIYFNRSLDRGATWLPRDRRLETDLPGEDHSELAQIVASGDSVYVIWRDGLSGESEIHFNIPFGALPYGEGTVGSGGLAPTLQGTDRINVGRSFTLTVTDGLGGAFGILTLGGYGSKVSASVVGRPQLINPIDLLAPILLNGASGVPGAGTYSIDIQIPADNALLGFNVNLQALFLDPSAAYGVAWTNGVEAWIL